ncbi:hypothetical protein ACE6H2_023820 [Prunus campanulata]
MYGSGCFYYCEPCHYIAHNRCAVLVDIDDLDDDEMIEKASKADHPINLDVQAQQITNEDLHEQIEHKYDNHPLKLTYDSVTNDDDEYYCKICEGERDPKYWFYRCEDCDFDFHPDCVLGRYSKIKLGSTYKHDAHPHPVTLVDKIKSVIPNDKRYEDVSPCEVCHEPCEGLVYECSECNINIHQNECCNLQEQAIAMEGGWPARL